ncbi:MAG TPA: hypothetical protein VI318_13460 [Baekduia sp.]
MQRHASHAHADVAAARAARDATDGRHAWVFASAAPHARLRLTGRDADADDDRAAPEAEGLALRTAGVAINAELPVAVLGAADGPLADAAFIGVPLPFIDGRVGALVVAGGVGLAARRAAVDALVELASAQVRRAGRVGAR